MIREVFIDGNQIDIENDNAAGYIFTSPIFRDITRILANRTTTYKVPKTSRNLTIFGLSDNPDVLTDFPYREHSFSEYRNGLIFISGICTLLKISDNEIELAVIWGNTINLLSLTGLKLRELKSTKYLRWGSDSAFLDNTSNDQFGFIVIDFGRGIDDFQYIHPSITMKGILDLITESTNVKFRYPDRFNEVFTKKWIPLLDKNANAITWQDYTVDAVFDGWWSNYTNVHGIKLRAGDNKHDIIQDQKIEWHSDCKVFVTFFIDFYDKNPQMVNGEYMDAAIGIIIPGPTPFYDRVSADADGHYRHQYTIEYDYSHTNPNIPLRISPFFSYVEGAEAFSKLNDVELYIFTLTTTIKQEKVQFGDKFPITPNLPDLSVIDYLKTIMQMYGLYTYYDYKLDDSTVEFISIDDVYSYKKDFTYDWTDKLVQTTRGKFNLTFTYGDYAQKNNFKYSKDDTVITNANGYLLIDNETIPLEKDIVDINFSPSDNTTAAVPGQSETTNTFALIKLYDSEGNTNSIQNRILTETTGYVVNGTTTYKSAYYDESLKFSGKKGLLNEYYTAFQHILRRPVIAECYVYLSDLELHNYREAYPVYIDGTYYMPVNVTVQTDSLAVCQLIRMPYIDPDVLKRG